MIEEKTDSPSDTTAPPPPTADIAEQNTVPSQLRQQLAEIFGLPATATEQDILQLASEQKAKRVQEAEDELQIKAKMDVGLNRQQAIAVIERQRVHDQLLNEERRNRLPVLLDIIGKGRANLWEARKLAREHFPFLDGGEWQAAVSAFEKASA